MASAEKSRKSLNLSQEAVASMAGISRQYYNAIENNRSKPSVMLAKKLASILKTDWTIFFADPVNK